MKVILLLHLFWLTGCATKYIIPGNRFITPETQGGAFRGQVEFQQTSANQLTIDTSNGGVEDGVTYEDVPKSGFLLSNSFFNQFDLFWAHTVSGTSMLGGKFQFIGSPRTANGAGHKMAVAVAIGGNEHETDDKSVEFELSGREIYLLYGYRFSPNVFPYLALSQSSYTFEGEIHSNNSLNGLDPKIDTAIRALNGGVELSMEAFFLKFETTYQQLTTSETKDKSRFIFGYSMGLSW